MDGDFLELRKCVQWFLSLLPKANELHGGRHVPMLTPLPAAGAASSFTEVATSQCNFCHSIAYSPLNLYPTPASVTM